MRPGCAHAGGQGGCRRRTARPARPAGRGRRAGRRGPPPISVSASSSRRLGGAGLVARGFYRGGGSAPRSRRGVAGPPGSRRPRRARPRAGRPCARRPACAIGPASPAPHRPWPVPGRWQRNFGRAGGPTRQAAVAVSDAPASGPASAAASDCDPARPLVRQRVQRGGRLGLGCGSGHGGVPRGRRPPAAASSRRACAASIAGRVQRSRQTWRPAARRPGRAGPATRCGRRSATTCARRACVDLLLTLPAGRLGRLQRGVRPTARWPRACSSAARAAGSAGGEVIQLAQVPQRLLQRPRCDGGTARPRGPRGRPAPPLAGPPMASRTASDGRLAALVELVRPVRDGDRGQGGVLGAQVVLPPLPRPRRRGRPRPAGRAAPPGRSPRR